MGEPDLFGYGYSDNALINLVHPHMDEYDFVAVLTCVPIQDNFFTRTVGQKVIIATSYQSEELLSASERTIEEYFSLAVCQELISFEFQRVSKQHWSNLFHQDTRGCIFDFAGIKSQKLAKLKTCEICPPCKGKLASINMNDNVVYSIEAILEGIRKPSLSKAFWTSVMSPVIGFVYGGIVIGAAVNVLSSVAMGQGPLTEGQLRVIWLLLLAIPLFPMTVYGWLWFRHFRRRLRG